MTKEETMKKISDMEARFGSVELDDEKYIIIEDAFLDNNSAGEAAYFALAIKAEDVPDEIGCVPAYRMEWEIINQGAEDDAEVCDWDNPADIRDVGAALDLENNRVF